MRCTARLSSAAASCSCAVQCRGGAAARPKAGGRRRRRCAQRSGLAVGCCHERGSLLVTLATGQQQERRALARQRQLQLLHGLLHALQLGLGLGELQLRGVADARLLIGQAQGLFARAGRGLGHLQLRLQRAQAHIGLGRGGGHGQGHGVAVGLAGLQAQGGGPFQVGDAAPQIRLPAGLQAGLNRARVRQAPRAQAAARGGAGRGRELGQARSACHIQVGPRLIHARQGQQHIVVAGLGQFHPAREQRIAKGLPPRCLDGGGRLLPCPAPLGGHGGPGRFRRGAQRRHAAASQRGGAGDGHGQCAGGHGRASGWGAGCCAGWGSGCAVSSRTTTDMPARSAASSWSGSIAILTGRRCTTL